jgi:hypothetical protein
MTRPFIIAALALATAVSSFQSAASTLLPAASPPLVLLADRTTGSIHRLNLGDNADTIVAEGLGALWGTWFDGRQLYVFNGEHQLFRVSFDRDWNTVSSDLLGNLAEAGYLQGNAIYVEGKNLYTAGLCGIARFRLTPGGLVLKGPVASVNVAGFATDSDGVLFAFGTGNGFLYQVSLTAGKRDWSTLQGCQVQVDRAAAIAIDENDDIVLPVSGSSLVFAQPLCPLELPGAVSPATATAIPEGISGIVVVKHATKDQQILASGPPLNFDPPTVGVGGIDVFHGSGLAICRTAARGSSLVSFSGNETPIVLWTTSDHLVSAIICRPE